MSLHLHEDLNILIFSWVPDSVVLVSSPSRRYLFVVKSMNYFLVSLSLSELMILSIPCEVREFFANNILLGVVFTPESAAAVTRRSPGYVFFDLHTSFMALFLWTFDI